MGRLLRAGRRVYGIAVDDAHYFKRPWDARAPKPGQGWVVVRAPRLDAAALLASLEAGDFYASTGVELDDYSADAAGISLRVRAAGDTRYRLTLIDATGEVETLDGPVARFTLTGRAGYARVVVRDSNGVHWPGRSRSSWMAGPEPAPARYTAIMQLRTARLCLDCDEVHDEYRCPVCASDEFTYVSRWVPVPENRRLRPRPARVPPPELEAYREIVRGPAAAPPPKRRPLGEGAGGDRGRQRGRAVLRRTPGARPRSEEPDDRSRPPRRATSWSWPSRPSSPWPLP